MGLWDTPPKTWTFEELVGAIEMNLEVRDRFLATLHLQKGFALAAGQGNAGGGADTQLTSYDVTLPANLLNQPGNGLIVEGTFVKGTTVETSTVKLQIASGTTVVIISTNGTSDIVPFRMVMRRRLGTTGSITGLSWIGAGGGGGAPTNYLVNAGLSSIDWTVSQTLKIFSASTTAAEMKLTDYHVIVFKGDGVLV